MILNNPQKEQSMKRKKKIESQMYSLKRKKKIESQMYSLEYNIPVITGGFVHKKSEG